MVLCTTSTSCMTVVVSSNSSDPLNNQENTTMLKASLEMEYMTSYIKYSSHGVVAVIPSIPVANFNE